MATEQSGFSRRGVLTGTAALVGAAAMPKLLFAAIAADTPVHGLSAFGELKYPPDFAHFGYVNADAPKGGEMRLQPWNWFYNQSTQTFNTLNSFAPKGDSPPRMEYCFDSLMVRALDEPDAVYGLIAETVSISADRNTFRFALRKQARWHDGSALTAHDCAFAYTTLRDLGHPTFQVMLSTLRQARAVDDHTLELEFDGSQNERAILSTVEVPIIQKAFYEANPFDGSSLTPPAGSGPYKVGRVSAGRTVVLKRVPDYWARDLGVMRGHNNFDDIRIEFYRERQAEFEAFKKGDIQFRLEFTSKSWATEYEFDAVTDGRIVKRTFPSELRPSMQAWAFNQRRERFADHRVRQAIALCFDFEWTRENFFYGSYVRAQSLFERSTFRAEGLPSEAEMALLEPWRGKIPDATFGEAVVQPVSDGSGRDRARLRSASQLLADAGWSTQDGKLRNGAGEVFPLEFLVNAEVFIRVYSPFIENLKLLGFDASLRLVDPAQYQSRLNDFDFDMMGMAASFTATPQENGLREFFGSKSATLAGSNNMPGTADPAVDAMLDAVGKADNRDALETAMRALDRLLRARFDWAPSWSADTHRAAFWDRFGFLEPKPDYGFPVEILWWEDDAKVAKIAPG
jgi:microcin C transport system substrate-binding protein